MSKCQWLGYHVWGRLLVSIKLLTEGDGFEALALLDDAFHQLEVVQGCFLEPVSAQHFDDLLPEEA